MGNNQDGNGKNNQVLTYTATKNITELNELIYARAKLDYVVEIGLNIEKRPGDMGRLSATQTLGS